MGKPSKAALGKRKAAPSSSKPSKKSKPDAEAPLKQSNGRPQRKPDQPKKVKLRDQKIIPVPKTVFAGDDNGMDLDLGDEEDEELDIAGAGFLTGLDNNALSRSTKETRRLHDLHKSRESMPVKRKEKVKIPLGDASGSDFDTDPEFPSDLDSDLEDVAEGSGSGSSIEESDEEDINEMYDEVSDSEDSEPEMRKRKSRKEEEAEYETSGRTRWAPKAAEAEPDSVEVGRLPIKLPTGEIQMVQGTTRIALPPSKKPPPLPESETEEEEEEEDIGSDDGAQATQMAAQKGKFGRMGVAEIVGMKGWKNAQKLEAAKEQIAVVGAEILAGGELVDNAPLLTRMSTFALPSIPSLEDTTQQLPVPASIRALAFLSQLAVYKDLIPGYRIRQLTEAEEAEKVRDEVRRLREGEKMLVRSYKGYLKMLEGEIKRRTPLMSVSLKCMAELLSSVTHFNFSENIMGVLVGRLGRKSWDSDSDLILLTFSSVFKNDNAAIHTQTLVRLIARMIKERKFQVHPNVLSCLLHLRLLGELDSMRDGKNAKGKVKNRGGEVAEGEDLVGKGKKFKSETRKVWATKNQRKKGKELKEVRKEMAEAEAEVDQDERAQIQTETLKNLFVLYFSILKSPIRSPMLPAALEGISHYGHFINVDFFRDLLSVLRRIVLDQQYENEVEIEDDRVGASARIRLRLLAIVTAFDLLSGQGESINIDLGDFINALFTLIRPLALDTGIEDPPSSTAKTARLQPGRAPPKISPSNQPTSSLLFHSLHSIFLSRTSHSSTNPIRTAAFAKRLLECSLLFPPNTARDALQFIREVMVREPKLEGMLDTEERMADGVYKPDMEDPALCNPFAGSFWEVELMAKRHWDRSVRGIAGKLILGNEK